MLLSNTLPMIERVAKSATSITEGMHSLLEYFKDQIEDKQYSDLRGLAWESDCEQLQTYFVEVLRKEPPSKTVDGLYFGLYNPIDSQGQVSCDIGVFGVSGIFEQSASDEEEDGEVYLAEEGEVLSSILAEIYRRSRGRRALSAELANGLSLAYAALVALRICREDPAALLSGGARERAVVVGFDEGDCLFLGTVGPKGFVSTGVLSDKSLNVSDEPPSSFSLLVGLDSLKGLSEERVLNDLEIWDHGGRSISASRFKEGRRLDLESPLRMGLLRSGGANDIEFIGSSVVPVVSRRAAKLFEDLAKDAVELIPVEIGESRDLRYIVNPVFIETGRVFFDSKQRLLARRRAEDRAEDRTLHAFGLDIENPLTLYGETFRIAVSDYFVDRLSSLGITGATFEMAPAIDAEEKMLVN